MERWLAKLISLFVLFILTTIAVLIPLKLQSVISSWGKTGEKIINRLMCFGGGVFFAIFLLHMGPESSALITQFILLPYEINYPLAELFMGLSFFLMILLDLCLKHKQGNYGVTACKEDTVLKETDTKDYDAISKDSSDVASDSSGITTGHIHAHNSTGAVVLLLALSLHHIFEGMSVGLKDNTSDVWTLTIGIIAHEIIIAFSLGLQLVRSFSQHPRRVIVAGILCQLMTPIGILIGLLLIETTPEDDPATMLTNGVLHCVSTGVFIYVTFCEILLEEYCNHPSLSKSLSVLAGFVVISLLMLVPEDGHIHSMLPSCINETQQHHHM